MTKTTITTSTTTTTTTTTTTITINIVLIGVMGFAFKANTIVGVSVWKGFHYVSFIPLCSGSNLAVGKGVPSGRGTLERVFF